MSRPKGTETPIDPAEVEKLASIGATQTEMAHWFGVSVSTVEKRLRTKPYRGIVERGRARLLISLRRKQVQLAESGDRTMLIWLGKQLLGQRDKLDQHHSGELTTVALVREILDGAKAAESDESRH